VGDCRGGIGRIVEVGSCLYYINIEHFFCVQLFFRLLLEIKWRGAGVLVEVELKYSNIQGHQG